MEKPKLGPHLFRACPTAEEPHPSMLACMVVAKNLYGGARLVVFEQDGNQSFLDNAVIVQADNDGCPCHYSDRLLPLTQIADEGEATELSQPAIT